MLRPSPLSYLILPMENISQVSLTALFQLPPRVVNCAAL
ncbi:Hypothetical protein CpCap5W_2140 [Corynebacterium pseudotuberculosis]|nr:Hypothetical protein Cp4202_2020 [Corynebacterium pseudotuberculosis 42/02-A]AEX40534.1 Hypothetical protein Cp3995_2092 [Corynebacterium pseudotuberculosis 3/99-5]AFH52973.1 Hypothetical protein Cp267_2103 [Corynebacterium pseudotuberculosis 267]AIG06266.1 hypothetical protein CPTA_00437 [Corynebacterium pseudotuberculosis]AIG09148.1 hypothetical protein CPTB_01092 [Corynebacterium pseudotuberculosis]